MGRMEMLPDDDALMKEISSITDQGNLRAVFLNMKFFLETGDIPRSKTGYSSLSAVIFGLPPVQNFIQKETGERISAADIREMGAQYFQAYQK